MLYCIVFGAHLVADFFRDGIYSTRRSSRPPLYSMPVAVRDPWTVTVSLLKDFTQRIMMIVCFQERDMPGNKFHKEDIFVTISQSKILSF
jgi:hypothetical protein